MYDFLYNNNTCTTPPCKKKTLTAGKTVKFALCTMSVVLIIMPIFALFLAMRMTSFYHFYSNYLILSHASTICCVDMIVTK